MPIEIQTNNPQITLQTGTQQIIAGVKTVNGMDGDVVLDYEDVGAAAEEHTHIMEDITDLPSIPTKTSQLTNDSGFITSHQDITGKEDKSNKVHEIDLSGITEYTENDPEYPNTYGVYNAFSELIGNLNEYAEWKENKDTSISANPTNDTYPSSKAVKDYVIGKGYITEDYADSKYAEMHIVEDNFIQKVASMPQASSGNENNIVQYIGNTNSTYTNGYFYKCIHTEVTEALVATQTAGDVSLGTITTDPTKFRDRILNNDNTIIFKAIGKPTKISVSNFNTFSFITLQRDTAYDICPINNPSLTAYGWKDTTNNTYYFTKKEVPGTMETIYSNASFSTESGYTFSGVTERSQIDAYWAVNNTTTEIDISNDYGIYFTSAPFPGDEITAVYTPGVNSYSWNRVDVQPQTDVSSLATKTELATVEAKIPDENHIIQCFNCDGSTKKYTITKDLNNNNISLSNMFIRLASTDGFGTVGDVYIKINTSTNAYYGVSSSWNNKKHFMINTTKYGKYVNPNDETDITNAWMVMAMRPSTSAAGNVIDSGYALSNIDKIESITIQSANAFPSDTNIIIGGR